MGAILVGLDRARKPGVSAMFRWVSEPESAVYRKNVEYRE